MGLKEQQLDATDQTRDAANSLASVSDGHHEGPRVSSCSTDNDSGLPSCRVCHCVEPDLRGESALGFLGIVPPSPPRTDTGGPKDDAATSPKGEIFVCATDVELQQQQQDHLVDLGCCCKNELALAHYACALKWFISHGSTACEICGTVAANVRPDDFNKVLASLKDYQALRESTSTHWWLQQHSGVDPDAVAAIRRHEISSWFNPHVPISQGHIDQPHPSTNNSSVLEQHTSVVANTRWSLESTGVFIAICLVVIILAWLVAPHVGKKAAVICLHMLLGGLCILTVVISLRFVFPRIQYGSMQYWAILFVSWFLVFGVWASRTRGARSS